MYLVSQLEELRVEESVFLPTVGAVSRINSLAGTLHLPTRLLQMRRSWGVSDTAQQKVRVLIMSAHSLISFYRAWWKQK